VIIVFFLKKGNRDYETPLQSYTAPTIKLNIILVIMKFKMQKH